MVDVTKPIVSVSSLCENGIVTHLARKPFLKHGERHEPLIKKNAVEAVMQDEGSKNYVCKLKDCQILKHVKIHAYELRDCKSIKNRAQAHDAVSCEDAVDDGRVLAEAGAGKIPVPCELSEFQKMKHE